MNFKVKQRIKVKFPFRGYKRGATYVIVRVNTRERLLTAADSAGKEGRWIRWQDCLGEPDRENITWPWLTSHLPSEALELLNAFEGVGHLRLSDTIRDRILMQLPNLKDHILAAQALIEEERCSAGSSPPVPTEKSAPHRLPF